MIKHETSERLRDLLTMHGETWYAPYAKRKHQLLDEKEFERMKAELRARQPELASDEIDDHACYCIVANAARRPKDANVVIHRHEMNLKDKLILLAVAIFLIVVLLISATRAHGAQRATGAGSGDKALTVIPLSDADKVKVLALLRKQDQLIMERKDHQLKIVELDKRASDIQSSLSDLAQSLAVSGKIDTLSLVLDIDKLAWVTKELTK